MIGKWSDLNEIQKASFGNGCGPRTFLRPPTIEAFTASCRQHDFYYTRGGGITRKLRADLGFFGHMILDAAQMQSFLGILLYCLIATVYFGLCLVFGVFFFRWGRPLSTKEVLERDSK